MNLFLIAHSLSTYSFVKKESNMSPMGTAASSPNESSQSAYVSLVHSL